MAFGCNCHPPGVGECFLSVKRIHSRFAVVFQGETWKRVKSISYVKENRAAQSGPVRRLRLFMSHGADHYTDHAPRPGSGDTKIVVQFWNDTTSREASVELRDAPLPLSLQDEG